MSAGSDLAVRSLSELSELVRKKEVSPVAVARTFLDRIDRLDGRLHSFNSLTPETALREAGLAEAEIQRGEWRGPLHGIPIGVKDMIDVAGLATTAQARHRQQAIAAGDAEVVARLRRAGAVILGKQAMSEYAVGGTQIDHVYPPVRNPWDLARDALSSSSGSSASVAAGLCPGSIGTETAGSIRAPAAWCGVAGLKPTLGLVSTRGVMPMSPTMDCVGPIAWTAEDCALLLSAMVARDRFPGPDLRAGDADGLRIGVVRHYFEDDPEVDPDIYAATQNAIDVFRDLAATCRDIHLGLLGDFDELCRIARTISWPEEYALYRGELAAHPERLTAVSRSRLQDGRHVSAADYFDALRQREKIVAGMEDIMREVDLLLLPTLKKPAQPLGFEFTASGSVDIDLTRPFNLMTGPALAVCHGFNDAGLPLSLQLIGRPGEDALLLRAGTLLEQRLDLRANRPEIARL